jgi:hypothetical protein
VFEEPSFGYNENTSKTCFDLVNIMILYFTCHHQRNLFILFNNQKNCPVRLEDFLNVSLSDVGPPCFIWLNIFHRFTIVQNITHPVTCNACDRSHFNGFRYKCQKCRKYQLCQDCFWRGRISHSHQLTHQMKEYTNYKSAAKQFSNSLRRSFFCKSSKSSSVQNPTTQTNNCNNDNSLTNLNYSSSQHLSKNNICNQATDFNNHVLNGTVSYSQSHTQANLLSSTNSCNLQPINNSSHNNLDNVSSNGCINNGNNSKMPSPAALSPNSIIKPKKIVQQTSSVNTLDENSFYNSESTKLADKTFDMKHIV